MKPQEQQALYTIAGLTPQSVPVERLAAQRPELLINARRNNLIDLTEFIGEPSPNAVDRWERFGVETDKDLTAWTVALARLVAARRHPNMTPGEQLRRGRERLHLPVEAAARLVDGITAADIIDWENETRRPTGPAGWRYCLLFVKPRLIVRDMIIARLDIGGRTYRRWIDTGVPKDRQQDWEEAVVEAARIDGSVRRRRLPPPHELVAIRLRAGISQKAMAEALGVNVSTLSSWEKGKHFPQDHHRHAYIQALRQLTEGQAGPQKGMAFLNNSWRERAACKDADTRLFFPDPTRKHPPAKAVELCSSCPVAAECYQYGIRTLSVGVWGGVLLR